MPSCASTLHVGKNFGMSASCLVADTSYRSMQAPVQYILFLSNSFVCTYVLAMKKALFLLINVRTYDLYVLSIAYVYVHNLYYRLVHTCILSQRTVTYFQNIITFFN